MDDPAVRAGGPPAVGAEDAAADVRTVAKGGGVQILGQIATEILAFVFIAAATHILSKPAYGLFRKAYQLLTVFGQVGLLGLNYSTMRFIAKARALGDAGGVRGAVRVGVMGTGAASLVVFALLFLGAPPIAEFFAGAEGDRQGLESLLRIGAAFVPLFALMQTLRYGTQAYKNMLPSVIVGNIVQPMARIVLGIAALVAGLQVAGLMWTTVISVAIGTALGFWYLRRVMTAEERAARPAHRIRSMLGFALPQAGSSILGFQALGLGIIVLGLYQSDAAVAVFGVALSLQRPGSIFLSGIVNIWAPMVTDLHARDEIARLDRLYKTVNRWTSTFSFPVYTALIAFPAFFVDLLTPAYGEAAVVTAVLAAGNLFYTGTGPAGYVISMTGRPWLNLINSAFAVGAYVGLGVLIVPTHGALGMAFVDAVVTAAINLARVVEAKLLVGVQPFGRSFLKPVGASCVMGAVLLSWRLLPEGFLVQLSGLLVAGLAYLGVLVALGVDEEERQVWRLIRSRLLRGRYRRARDASGAS
ncbi:flippase [soil metagenome]